MGRRRAGFIGVVIAGGMLAFANVAWACVPGHDMSSTGGTMVPNNAAATPPAAAPLAAAAPEAAAPGSPALPAAPDSAASPVTGAGMFNDLTPASSKSSDGGTQVVGLGLFAVGGVIVLGGAASVARARRPKS